MPFAIKKWFVFFQVVKINKWDGAAAKNAIDDAIREVNRIIAIPTIIELFIC